jgi:hypothetical protein
MANWGRSTPWRQGQFLPSQAVAAFGLSVEGVEPNQLAVVVVSHDCDLAQPVGTEPWVEVIVGRFIQGPPDGTYTNSKNLRKLHLICMAPHQQCTVELEILRRRALPKDEDRGSPGLVAFEPALDYHLESHECRVLQSWLAARYRRAAFPDEFDRRLSSRETTSKLGEKLAKILQPTSDHVIAVFFDIEEPERVREGADDPYELRITLAYSTQRDPAIAAASAKSAAAGIEAAFHKHCCTVVEGLERWNWIELVGPVQVLSDEALTYAQSHRLSKWQADQLSFRSDPAGPVLE